MGQVEKIRQVVSNGAFEEVVVEILRKQKKVD